MNPNIDQIILELKTLNDNFEVPLYEIKVAVKVCRMWKYLKEESSLYDAQEISEIEGRFFPTIIKAKVVAYIESGYDYSALDVLKAIQEVQGVKGAAISNVKEK